MLLAHTENDQQNIIMTGESAAGKSWITAQIAYLFPREGVIEPRQVLSI
jgi:adenylylsulfate kinase-like enzyme